MSLEVGFRLGHYQVGERNYDVTEDGERCPSIPAPHSAPKGSCLLTERRSAQWDPVASYGSGEPLRSRQRS